MVLAALGAVRHGALEAEADAEVVRQLLGLGRVPRVEVVDEASPFADEREEAPPRGVVLGVRDHVVRDVLDARREERDLDLGRAAVRVVARVRRLGRGALLDADLPRRHRPLLDVADVGLRGSKASRGFVRRRKCDSFFCGAGLHYVFQVKTSEEVLVSTSSVSHAASSTGIPNSARDLGVPVRRSPFDDGKQLRGARRPRRRNTWHEGQRGKRQNCET